MTFRKLATLAFTFCFIISMGNSVSFSQLIQKHRNGEIMEDSTFQVSLGPRFSNMVCHSLIIQPTAEDSFSTIYSFQLSSSSGSKIAFSIIDTIEGCEPFPDYEFVDLNFDDYKDLRYVVGGDPHGGIEWHAWILNPDSNTFQLNDEFSKLPRDLSFDETDKTIAYSGYSFYAQERVTWDRMYRVSGIHLFVLNESQTSDFAADGETFSEPDSSRTETNKYQYDFTGNRPNLIEHTEIIEITKNGKQFITTTIRKKSGDQMLVVSKKRQVLKN